MTAGLHPPEPPRHTLEIFVISLAGLLLEIAFTRVISFKLFYYYTYLTIGLALLGLGSGAVLVAVSTRLRAATADSVLRWTLTLGAASTAVAYLVVARLPIATAEIWLYGSRASFSAIARLLIICVALALPFVSIGLLVTTILSRGAARIGTLYFADLMGAGLACLVVVWLIATQGPPATIALAGALLALLAVRSAMASGSRLAVVAGLLALPLIAACLWPSWVPDVRTDSIKSQVGDAATLHSEWSPIFRVDALQLEDRVLLFHDGLLGSAIYAYDGDPSTLTRFDDDPRSLPFAAHPETPGEVLIIGAAGGNEILASKYFGAGQIDAVELNPVTHDLLSDDLADYAGNLAEDPSVNYVQGDGRTYLARSDSAYDLVWFPAPDSYAAQNAATSGAFVLSESYLYTEEMITESLDHLAAGGILVAQFGEVSFDSKPNRTARYVSTVRAALEARGGHSASQVAVITTPTDLGASRVATILVKDEPFTTGELDALAVQAGALTGATAEYVPDGDRTGSVVAHIITATDDELGELYDSYGYDVAAISDDGPFFWSFARFPTVLRHFDEPLRTQDLEDSAGERVIILLLVIALLFAGIFLLLPFVKLRDVWGRLPHKGTSAVYFGAIGLGFLLFEITLIQQLVLLLGFPTYSLTVTIASLLIFTGIGALLSGRLPTDRPTTVALSLGGVLTVLTGLYLVGLPELTDALLDTSLTVRVLATFLVLAPLGLCLGTFMPQGIRAVTSLTEHPEEYVAWGWAINGFASVVASVLTTILAMTFGFQAVLLCALAIYAVALLALRRLQGFAVNAIAG